MLFQLIYLQHSTTFLFLGKVWKWRLAPAINAESKGDKRGPVSRTWILNGLLRYFPEKLSRAAKTGFIGTLHRTWRRSAIPEAMKNGREAPIKPHLATLLPLSFLTSTAQSVAAQCL